jgi:hypothetical protein
MTFCAIIIDDREDIAKEAIERHKPYLPAKTDIFHIRPPYEGGIYSLKSTRDYNSVLTNPAFWSGCRYDRVLIFQHDSGLLRHGIEEFLQWDYIGAPIAHMPGYMNGGLSIRNPKLMYQICKDMPYQGMQLDGNEDIYFVENLRRLSAYLPDLETAKRFSVETIFSLGSLGYHAMDRYLSPEQVKQILNQYD